MALGVYQNSVANADGTPAASLSIIVTESVSGSPATIYADETGGTPLGSLQTDELGYFTFAAAGGFYDIQFGVAEDAPTWRRIAIGTFQAEDYDRVWRPGESSESLADAVAAIQTNLSTLADSEITSTPATTGITGATNVESALTSLQSNTAPEGTQVVIARDDTGALVAAPAASDGTFVIDTDGNVRAIAILAATTFEELAVTATRQLVATDAAMRIVTAEGQPSGIVKTVLKPLHGTPSTAIALQVPADIAHGTEILVRRPGNQTGAVTLELVGAGTINGGTDPVTIPRKRLFAIYISNAAGNAPTVETTATVEDGLTEVVTTTGTVTLNVEEHNGAHVIADNNVTIPTTEGMSGTVIATAGLDVLFNSTTVTTCVAGDIVAYVVRSSTVIDATKSARLVPA